MERRHQPVPGLCECWSGQPTTVQTWSRKVPAVTTQTFLTTPSRLKVPAPSDPVKRLNFRKADWKHFCFLTGETVEILPPPDTTNIERAYQEFCVSLLSAAKQCIPRGRRKNYVPCWDKRVRDPSSLLHPSRSEDWIW